MTEPEIKKKEDLVGFDPPPHIFKYGGKQTDVVMKESQSRPILEKIVAPKEGGIYAYFKGMPFPMKGWPTPEAVNAINYVKRYIVTQVKFFAQHPITLLPFIRKSVRYQWMFDLKLFSRPILTPYILHEQYYSNFAKALKKFLAPLLISLCGERNPGEALAIHISTIFEYDAAYRYRVQDLMSETTKEKLMDNPRKEIARLVEIFKKREPKPHLQRKFAQFARILSYSLLIPSVRTAFKKALAEVDFPMLQLDEADRYHCMIAQNYEFFGIPFPLRQQAYIKLHNGNLPQYYTFEGDIERIQA